MVTTGFGDFFLWYSHSKIAEIEKKPLVGGFRDAVSIVISSNEQEITIKVLKLFEIQFIFPWSAASLVFQKV